MLGSVQGSTQDLCSAASDPTGGASGEVGSHMPLSFRIELRWGVSGHRILGSSHSSSSPSSGYRKTSSSETGLPPTTGVYPLGDFPEFAFEPWSMVQREVLRIPAETLDGLSLER